MAPPTLFIREMSRAPEGGPEDRLAFEPGVNVLVGQPNTGKSKWLIMLDYLLGDDGNPKEKFEDLFEKYNSARIAGTIGGEEFTVERRWREQGLMTKAILNGKTVALSELHQFYLDKLGLKPFRFPQGNPYGSRTWPTLGWRGLVRHMYRRQRFWSDLADQQQESEQHACLLQFLGIGERLFTVEYADLVARENRIRMLEVEREQFLNVLDTVSREILDTRELGVAITPQSVEEAMQRLREEIATSSTNRERALRSALSEVNPDPGMQEPIEMMGKELVSLRAQQDNALQAVAKAEERSVEIAEQKQLLEEEMSRLERAKVATRILPRLKITHCPACDQVINEPPDVADPCFLCRRPRPLASGSDEDADKRLEFERSQIRAELRENDELLTEVTKEISKLNARRRDFVDRIRNVEENLRPVRIAVAAIVPTAVSVIDVESGRLQERLRQMERIKGALGKREQLNEQIRQIQDDVTKLESEVRERKTEIDFQDAAQHLQDGMNTYLNKINIASKGSWTQDAAIRVSVGDRDFCLRVGKSNWATKLGGTQTLLFLLAYHFALLRLTSVEGCHFPGFTSLDFPAKLHDGSPGITRDKENFVLVPFIELLGSEGMEDTQLIVAGNAFDGLSGVHRIPLTHIWKVANS